VLLATIVLLLHTAATASIVALDFTRLPSAQGWTYASDGAAESSIFSVSGGVLSQDTTPGPFTFEAYDMQNVVAFEPFTIFVRARVLAESGNFANNSFGFCVIADTGGEAFGFGIGTGRIEDIPGNVLSTTIDNTTFHEYRMEVTPGVGYEFFVDDVLVATGAPGIGQQVAPSNLRLGDSTRGTGAHAEVTSFAFCQPVPTTTTTTTATTTTTTLPPAGHLKCYKIKDPAAKAAYTADLAGLTAEPGCRISVPAKQLCVDTTKTNVVPTPPGGGPPTGGNAGKFLCYKIKCPKGSDVSVPAEDQFGSRSVTAKIGGKLLCAPSSPSGAFLEGVQDLFN